MTIPESPDNSVKISPSVGPKIAKVGLAQRLRVLRENRRLTPADVASAMEFSQSKLTRIEKGEVSVQPLEVRALLNHYGVTDDDEIALLLRLARTSRSRQWYSSHRLTGAYADFIAYENEALVIKAWQLLFVPGLVQTEEYAHASTARTLRTSPENEEVKVRVRLRMDRQQALHERLGKPGAPRMVMAIDEAVLRRPIGGRDVLRRQLDHLLELGENSDTYSFAVTPLDLEHHSGLGGSFELLKFAGRSHGDVLFVEAAAGQDFILTDHPLIDRHSALFQDLIDYGRTGEDALKLIRSCRDALRAG